MTDIPARAEGDPWTELYRAVRALRVEVDESVADAVMNTLYRARAAVEAQHRAEVEKLTQERDEGWRRATVNQNAAFDERVKKEKAEAERDALAAQVATLREEAARCENAQCITCGRHFVDDAAAEGGTKVPPLKADEVEWVVNDSAELGVKIGQQFFWCYKGRSLVYKDGTHDDGTPMYWRPVFKREFGECIHPINYRDLTKIGTVSLDDSDEWKPLPALAATEGGSHE